MGILLFLKIFFEQLARHLLPSRKDFRGLGMELATRCLRKSLIIKHLRGAPPTPTQVVDYQALTHGAG